MVKKFVFNPNRQYIFYLIFLFLELCMIVYVLSVYYIGIY